MSLFIILAIIIHDVNARYHAQGVSEPLIAIYCKSKAKESLSFSYIHVQIRIATASKDYNYRSSSKKKRGCVWFGTVNHALITSKLEYCKQWTHKNVWRASNFPLYPLTISTFPSVAAPWPLSFCCCLLYLPPTSEPIFISPVPHSWTSPLSLSLITPPWKKVWFSCAAGEPGWAQLCSSHWQTKWFG